jgi:TRAP transporter 4TM/12TM fusion protein
LATKAEPREPAWQEIRTQATQIVGFFAAAFVLAVQPFYLIPQEQALPAFLSIMLVFIFLKYPVQQGGGGRWGLFLDALMIVLSLIVGLYIIINYKTLLTERLGIPLPIDIVFGVMAILLVLEATRRSTGLAMVIVGVAFLAYAFLGPHLPGLIGHRGYGLDRLISKLYLSNDGLYGLPLRVLLQYVVLFVLFGSLLEASGAAQFLTDLARSLAGGLTGGVAKVAVIASALMGTASGSAVANVVGTGSVTIPTMKKAGYAPHVAGAVEALASTGGQIMPPVMGAAAFLMADFLQIPYTKVALAALLPATMYFLSCYLAIHFYAVQNSLMGLPREKLPRLGKVLRSGGYYLIPIVGIVYMLATGYSPTMAGFAAVVLAFLTSFLNKKAALWPRRLYAALCKGGESFGDLTAISACAGIVMAVLGLTGLGPRLSGVLIDMAGNSTLLLLVLTAVTSIIMGMGVPTTVAYIVLATLIAPALTTIGANIVASHLFIFYFGMISMITPPVALAAYAAAAIAKCGANKLGWTAFRFALPSLFIAFFFVYNPGLLFVDGLGGAVEPLLRACLAVISLSAALSGHLLVKTTPWQRVLLVVGAFGTLHIGLATDLLAFFALLIVVLWQLRQRKASLPETEQDVYVQKVEPRTATRE